MSPGTFLTLLLILLFSMFYFKAPLIHVYYYSTFRTPFHSFLLNTLAFLTTFSHSFYPRRYGTTWTASRVILLKQINQSITFILSEPMGNSSTSIGPPIHAVSPLTQELTLRPLMHQLPCFSSRSETFTYFPYNLLLFSLSLSLSLSLSPYFTISSLYYLSLSTFFPLTFPYNK